MAKKKYKPNPIDPRAQRVINGMQSWLCNVNRKRRQTAWDSRTGAEQAFDSGVMAAAEFVRRITNDDSLALMIHECCVWRQREIYAESQSHKDRAP